MAVSATQGLDKSQARLISTAASRRQYKPDPYLHITAADGTTAVQDKSGNLQAGKITHITREHLVMMEAYILAQKFISIQSYLVRINKIVHDIHDST